MKRIHQKFQENRLFVGLRLFKFCINFLIRWIRVKMIFSEQVPKYLKITLVGKPDTFLLFHSRSLQEVTEKAIQWYRHAIEQFFEHVLILRLFMKFSNFGRKK